MGVLVAEIWWRTGMCFSMCAISSSCYLDSYLAEMLKSKSGFVAILLAWYWVLVETGYFLFLFLLSEMLCIFLSWVSLDMKSQPKLMVLLGVLFKYHCQKYLSRIHAKGILVILFENLCVFNWWGKIYLRCLKIDVYLIDGKKKYIYTVWKLMCI